MNVRATVIGPWLAIAIAMIVSGADILRCAHVGMLMFGVAQMPVHERVRLGKLRRVQDRQLSPAQHGDGEQYDDQELSHDPVHVLSRPASAPFVKSRPKVT
ncbi:hypothetical protein [Hyphomicrobium sp. 1Nfss2.1]|uniref:hypothetical protein n=1 Tax=Hyphomicrobium sp. 1Nfss2.1 TaxID=3413936 RepID=UPI003C7E3A2E